MSEASDVQRHAPAADVEEILRLSREWWEANITFDIPRMVKVFPSPGDDYLMFNFNGHPYYGMKEKVALWEWYAERVDSNTGFDVRVMRVEVHGDMAWLACEGHLLAHQAESEEWTADSVTTPYFRATEIYHRDDGVGNPAWRMWHFHCSPTADLREVRMGFDDTYESRGLGWVPWEPLPVREP